MNTNEHTVRVLTMEPVFPLPRELEGPFKSGQVLRGPERPVSGTREFTEKYMRVVMAAMRASGHYGF